MRGSSTGPGGFAGHLGFRASAIMPDVDRPAPTQGEVSGDTDADDGLTETDYDSDLLEDVPGRGVGGESSQESVTAGQSRRTADPRPRKTSRKQTQACWTMISGVLSAQERSQLLRARKQQQRKDKGAVVPHHMCQTFGGINMWAQAHTREALQEKQQFGAHTQYVCGSPESIIGD